MTLCSRQNYALGGEKKKKKLCSVIRTYLPYSFDSFIHSFWWQLQATQKRVALPLATIKAKSFPVPPSFGATPAVAVKELKRIFFFSQGRKQKILSLWMSRGQFCKRINERQYTGSFGSEGHFGMSSDLLGSFCFIFIYFLSILFVTLWGEGEKFFSGNFWQFS